MSSPDQYLTSFYFILTTFSTVGYGDISATNPTEKIFCIVVMCLGVTAFAAGTSTLTNLLQNYNVECAYLDEKIEQLNKIHMDYCLPLKLYDNVKKSISHVKNNDLEDMMTFVEHLPQDLRNEVTLFIFESTFKKFKFFNEKPIAFIAWICPLLKPMVKLQDQYIFFEGDDISCIYFF